MIEKKYCESCGKEVKEIGAMNTFTKKYAHVECINKEWNSIEVSGSFA